MTTHAWFDVDKDGIAKLLDRRGRHRVIAELPSNAFDETITFCSISVAPSAKRGITTVSIEDDSPDGFRRLSDAWTLFAPSYKTGLAEKRGRFNLGEKLFLSMCEDAMIATTTGTVRFDGEGRHVTSDKREQGTVLSAFVRMTKPEASAAVDLLRTLIAPAGVDYYVNGELIEPREAILAFDAALPTEIETDEGWRSSARKTVVMLYEPLPGETPHIYEMGIPVVEYDGRWHVSVGQKVPLNSDRDNVTPSYLRKLHTAVLDNSLLLLNEGDTTSTWLKEAMPGAKDSTIQEVVRKRFGDNAVIYDPSDLQANKEAVLKGHTVIPPRTFDKDTWARIRDAGILQPAGRVTPSNSTIVQSADGIPPVPYEKWTPSMKRLAAYAKAIALDLLGIEPEVRYHNTITIAAGAWYGHGELTLNIGRLGRAWVDNPKQETVDALLIHEFAHHKVADHLSHDFYHELCRLGARLRGCPTMLDDFEVTVDA